MDLRIIATIVEFSRTVKCITKEMLPKCAFQLSCAVSPLDAEAESDSAQSYPSLQTPEHALDLHLEHVIP